MLPMYRSGVEYKILWAFHIYTTGHKVVAAVEEQFLSTDILQPGVMERPVLPPNLETIRCNNYCTFHI